MDDWADCVYPPAHIQVLFKDCPYNSTRLIHIHTFPPPNTHTHTQWSSEKLQAVGHYPEQTACERTERLYHDVIRLFDRGKTWECGVPLCKELAEIYETELFDYQQLASILVCVTVKFSRPCYAVIKGESP